ncbi:asparagine synthase (glutamine-hydrolyzing) [Streptomyces sp. NPDC052101]|uniref:asparagine synthase (glutamine-hydrolyzing) n=1 Tax=Streptomyces sp. NPDC052101 TaxID=3155763 RepID=UPI0034159330
MCRIFGHFGPRPAHYATRLAAAAQRHGGPDAQTVVTGDGWSLGNNRLAIMDPAHGHQPYRLGDVVAVFNGEIYNHADLRRDLRRRGYVFDQDCDGSIIPALYHEFGLSFADLLDGMFAIAVVDLRAAPTLVLATDEAGMKSLYYHWDQRTGDFYFASEIPGLLCFSAVGTDLWLPSLEEYLATKVPFGEQTMFADIKALPTSTTAVVSVQDGLRIIRRTRELPEPTPHAAAAPAEVVHGELARAVDALTHADVPVCAITSGGLDSSFVTVLAKRSVPDLHTFNIAYKGVWPGEERHFAQEVADAAGTTHHQVEIDPRTFPDMLPDVVWHLGQPNVDPITLSTYALFRAVREAGFKVALTGDASDEMFGGYDRLRQAVLATGEWRIPYLEALAAVKSEARFALYSRDYRMYISSLRTGRDDLADILCQSRPRMDVLSEVEIGHRLPAYHLRRVDHLSMAHGVEARLPFCQRNVVDLAASLPVGQKIDADGVKKVLYRAAQGQLPASVLKRPKQPFTLPVNAMLRAGTPLMTYAEDMLHADRMNRRGLLDGRAVSQLLATQRQRPNDAVAMAIWSLLIFETWTDQFCVRTAGRRPQPELLEVAS